jgi:predicted dehydrogenase
MEPPMNIQNTASSVPELGVAMIGSGLMAKSHTMGYRNVESVYGKTPYRPRFAVLADVKKDLARTGAESLGYQRWTVDWREAVADPEVDVVDIVTPNFLHKEIAMAAIAAGKHVYCEKPLALSAADAKEMYEAAEAAGVKTLVGFNYLRNPAVAEARRLIAAGELGEIWTFSGRFVLDACSDPDVPFTWRFKRALSGSGALGDLGAHIISLAHVLVGPISSVAGLSRTFIKTRPEPTGVFGYGSGADLSAPRHEVENDDATTFLIEFASGASGHIEASRVATGRTWHQSIEVIGSKGAVQFVQQDIHTLRLYLTGDPAERKGYREIELGPTHGDYGAFWPFAGVPLGVHELKIIEVHEWLSAIADDRRLDGDFEEGWHVCEVLEAVERSAAARRWIDVPTTQAVTAKYYYVMDETSTV